MQGVELAGCPVWKPGSAPASGVPCQRTPRCSENSVRELGTEKLKPQIQSLERSNKNIPLLQLFFGNRKGFGAIVLLRCCSCCLVLPGYTQKWQEWDGGAEGRRGRCGSGTPVSSLPHSCFSWAPSSQLRPAVKPTYPAFQRQQPCIPSELLFVCKVSQI